MTEQGKLFSGTNLVINFDGACSGNPGPAGAGVVVRDESGQILAAFGKYLGEATNNQAEYKALILGLEWAAKLSAENVKAIGDSQLVIRQMQGEYKVKNEGLKKYHAEARKLAGVFAQCEFIHVMRDKNKDADRLGGKAVKLKADVEE